MSIPRLIFQTNPFRSGSTLLYKMLNAHPQVSAINGDDVKFFRFCYNRYLPLNKKNIQKLLEDESHRLFYRYKIKLDTKKCFETIQKKPFTHATIYKAILMYLSKKKASKFILDQETLAWTKIPLFLEWFSDSKALLTIRDLRDVVISFKKLTIAPNYDYLISIFNVIDAMDHALEIQQKYPKRFYCVRYENLKSDPTSEIKKICSFLEIDFDPRMLNSNYWKDYDGQKWKNETHSIFYNCGEHRNPVGRWRRLITKEDLFLCEWIGKKQMKKFGMKLEGEKVTDETFHKAIQMITSSSLLRTCFKHWCKTEKGVERYPLNPLNPKNWNKNSIHNLSAFKLN